MLMKQSSLNLIKKLVFFKEIKYSVNDIKEKCK